MMRRTQFPALGDLIGGWFHQDYDLGGDSLHAILDRAAATLDPRQVAAVLDDIDRFRAATPVDRDAAFLATFEPDADPPVFGLDATGWLAAVEQVLRRASGA